MTDPQAFQDYWAQALVWLPDTHGTVRTLQNRLAAYPSGACLLNWLAQFTTTLQTKWIYAPHLHCLDSRDPSGL